MKTLHRRAPLPGVVEDTQPVQRDLSGWLEQKAGAHGPGLCETLEHGHVVTVARKRDARRLSGDAAANNADAQTNPPARARPRYYADKGKMAMDSFHLHERLAADTTLIADWALSRVLLMNDACYPWLILVPRRVALSEVHDLKHAERMVLIEEINRASLGLKTLTNAVKINVGALGNLVPQLHIHIVARKPGDAAWPGPVWGNGQPAAYEQDVKDALIGKLREKL